MKRCRFDYQAFGIERPFPWLAVAIGAGFGLALVPLLAWLGFELIDQNLESFTP